MRIHRVITFIALSLTTSVLPMQYGLGCILVNEGAGHNVELFRAIEKSSLDEVKKAVSNGADIDLGLLVAVGCESLEIIQWLLERGASVHVSKHIHTTPLHIATLPSSIPLLLKAEADINDEHGPRGKKQTALVHALTIRNWDVAKTLIEHNADPNIPDCDGFTALHHATKRQRWDPICPSNIVSLLIRRGAHINIADKEKRTPLHFVSFPRNHLSMRVLAEHNADVCAINQYGDTPLHLACFEACHRTPDPQGIITLVALAYSQGKAQKLLNIKNNSGEIAATFLSSPETEKFKPICDPLQTGPTDEVLEEIKLLAKLSKNIQSLLFYVLKRELGQK